ncbi:MAG: PilN domain-containing protein [Chloroflexi bacterium]|nr:PilN domain-containing protein [Chloroflexota bacterium]
MRAVNLLPRDAERARRTTPDPALLIGVAGLAIVVAALFSMYMSASGKVQDKTGERSDLQIELNRLTKVNPPPKVLPAQAKVAALRSGRIDAVSNALAYRIPWNNILGQLSLVMPSGVKLTTLAASTPVSANPQFNGAAVGKLSITGWAYSQESVFLLLTRLKVLPPLTDVALVSSTINAGGSPVTYTFSISAQIRPPETIS